MPTFLATLVHLPETHTDLHLVIVALDTAMRSTNAPPLVAASSAGYGHGGLASAPSTQQLPFAPPATVSLPFVSVTVATGTATGTGTGTGAAAAGTTDADVVELSAMFAPRADGVVDCEHLVWRMTYAQLQPAMINVSLLVAVVSTRLQRPVCPSSSSDSGDALKPARPAPALARPVLRQSLLTDFIVPADPSEVAPHPQDDEDDDDEGSADRRWLDGCTLVLVVRDVAVPAAPTFEIHLQNASSAAVSALLCVRSGHVVFLHGLTTHLIPVASTAVEVALAASTRLVCVLSRATQLTAAPFSSEGDGRLLFHVTRMPAVLASPTVFPVRWLSSCLLRRTCSVLCYATVVDVSLPPEAALMVPTHQLCLRPVDAVYTLSPPHGDGLGDGEQYDHGMEQQQAPSSYFCQFCQQSVTGMDVRDGISPLARIVLDDGSISLPCVCFAPAFEHMLLLTALATGRTLTHSSVALQHVSAQKILGKDFVFRLTREGDGDDVIAFRIDQVHTANLNGITAGLLLRVE
jgi:hypothetical protein